MICVIGAVSIDIGTGSTPPAGAAAATTTRHRPPPPPQPPRSLSLPLQLESALVPATREEGEARQAELRSELDKAQAAQRYHLEKAARSRCQHERWVRRWVPLVTCVRFFRKAVALHRSEQHPYRSTTSCREKKALQGQADDLAAQLQQQHLRHEAELRALRQEHEERQCAAAAELVSGWDWPAALQLDWQLKLVCLEQIWQCSCLDLHRRML